MENVLNTLFPPKCFYCGVNYGDVCKVCLQECKIARNYYCLVCDKPSVKGNTHEMCKSSFTPTSIFSSYEYGGIIRKCIRQSKYSSRTFAPLKSIAKEASYIASKCGVEYKDFIATPIPLSKGRSKERGFNQAGLIAVALAKEFSIRYEDNILVRNKETVAQHKKTRKERFENMKDAFRVEKDLNGGKFVLVDDICTTGATLLEASKALYARGAKEVRCFTLAKEF